LIGIEKDLFVMAGMLQPYQGSLPGMFSAKEWL
jgi:hypothetical protein